MLAKTELRAIYRARREALSLEEQLELNKDIITNFLSLNLLQDIKSIALYSAISSRNEISTKQIHTELAIVSDTCKKNVIITYPKCYNDNEIRFHHVSTLSGDFYLKEGRFGIKEPDSRCPIIGPENIGVCIVPGLVFDVHGHRIGYGMGHYDRVLQHCNTKKIALAYDFQVLEEIPYDTYDIPVDLIVTEKRVIHCENIKT